MTIHYAKDRILLAHTLIFALTLMSCKLDDSIAIPESASSSEKTQGAEDQVNGGNTAENQPAPAPPEPDAPAADRGSADQDSAIPTPTSPLPIPPALPLPSPSTTPAPSLVNQTIPDGSYLIKSLASGRCLDIPQGSSTVGTQVQIFACNNNIAQVWNVTHVSDNFFKITNPNGRSLEVRNGLLADTSPVQIGNFSSLNTQLFKLEKLNDSFRILAKNSDFAIDIENFGIVDRSKVVMYAREEVDTQKWTIVSSP